MYYIVVLIYVNECFLNCQEVDSLAKLWVQLPLSNDLFSDWFISALWRKKRMKNL